MDLNENGLVSTWPQKGVFISWPAFNHVDSFTKNATCAGPELLISNVCIT